MQWSITSLENGGTVYGGGTASVTQKFISQNAYGYDEYEVSATGLNVPRNGNTYWLNLQNAKVPSGNPVYWDENDGVGCKGDDGHGGGCPSEADWPGCLHGAPLLQIIKGKVSGGRGSVRVPSIKWVGF